jgi:hypothetical protein
MKRITVTGSDNSEHALVTKALSIMYGYDLCMSPSYSQLAGKYGLSMDIEACQWPDSYVYCLGAFTERAIVEQQYSEKFVSDGSVLKEIVWLRGRYSHIELVYEHAMIHSLERVLVEYVSRKYDAVFHLPSLSGTDTDDVCFRRLFAENHIACRFINAPDAPDALRMMADQLEIKPVMPATFALSKAMRERNFK